VIALCGPGRTLLTALILALDGEVVSEITESANLPDPGMILLIHPAASDLPPWDDFRAGLANLR
jgi:hypothetical protein